MVTEPTATVALVDAWLDLLREQGVPVEPALRACGFDGVDLSDPEARVPVRRIVDLQNFIARELDDPQAGLRTAMRASPRNMSWLGYLVANSPTLQDAWANGCQYLSLLSQGAFMRMEREGDIVRLEYELNVDGIDSQYAAQSSLGAIVAIGRLLSGEPVTPIEAFFRHPRPRDVSLYRELFGDAVHFDAPSNLLRLRGQDGDLPVIDPDDRLLAMVKRHADELREIYPPTAAFVHDARVAIGNSLRSEAPSLAGVARRLAVSPRTLQRRLHEFGASFQKLVAEVRLAEAKRLLDGSLPYDEIATKLRYGSTAAFSASFKRGTGRTPSEYRKRPNP